MKRLGLALVLVFASPQGFAQQDQPVRSSLSSSQPASAAQEPKFESATVNLTPDASGNLSQEQMRQLIRVVTENYRANYKNERDYTYFDREAQNKLGGKDEIKSSESKTYEIMELYGEQVRQGGQSSPLPALAVGRERRLRSLIIKDSLSGK